MITKSIKAPSKPGVWDRWRDRNVSSSPINLNTYPRPVVDIKEESQFKMKQQWPKEKYTVWIEGIKEVYKRGGLVTFTSCRIKENGLPVYYAVTDICEIWYTATYDEGIYQPKALYLQYEGAEGRVKHGWWCAPSRLRPLTTEELALVNLQDRPTQGSA